VFSGSRLYAQPLRCPPVTPKNFMEILNQLGSLVLGSVPTIIFLILLVVLYGFIVRRPLDKVLAERRSRTSGAVEQAKGAIAAAEAETAVYEDKLRSARAELAKARELRLQKWQAERDAALDSARNEAQAMVRAARREVEDSAVTARKQMEDVAGELSDQILRALLPSGASLAEARK
jgi:F-type H+-transporting ATPase subunit b